MVCTHVDIQYDVILTIIWTNTTFFTIYTFLPKCTVFSICQMHVRSEDTQWFLASSHKNKKIIKALLTKMRPLYSISCDFIATTLLQINYNI